MRPGVIKTRGFPVFIQIEWERMLAGVDLKKFLAYLIFVTCFLVGLFLYIWPTMQLLQSGFQYSGMEMQRERLSEENRALRVELGALTSLDRVEQIARDELGMVAPGENQVIYVVLEKTPRQEKQ